MIISEKQIMNLLSQLRDHIALYERLASIGTINPPYLEWLYDLRDEINNQQTEELKQIE